MLEIKFSGQGDDLQVLIGETEQGKVFVTENGSWEPLSLLRNLKEGEGRKLCRELARYWPFMPKGKETTLKLPRLFLKQEIKEEAVFFGGSFNPWHIGHQACLDICPGKNIIVVPDSNPFKERPGDLNCPWEQYLELCLKLKETPYSVYPGFCGIDEPNPTVGWLPLVKLERKSFLLGDDSFLAFPSWKDYKALIQSLDTLYVVPRKGSAEELERMREELLKLNPILTISLLEHHAHEDVSSTMLRREKS